MEPVLNDYQEAVRNRITKITTALEHELGLDGWLQITHQFDPGFDSDETGTTAETFPQWEYRCASITWFIPVAATQTDAELEAAAIHEYLHLLLAPIATLMPKGRGVEKLEEFVTESLMRVIGHARGMTIIR